MTLVYVAGVGFSGSTLLSFLANSHPDLVSVGELTGPQPAAPANYPCSCGQPVRACEFWKKVSRLMEAAGASFDPLAWDTRFDLGASRWSRHFLVRSLRNRSLDRARDRAVELVPSYRRRLEELFSRNRLLAQAIIDVSGRRVLLDASKHASRAHFLTRAGFDLRVVHLVRDALGFVASCRKNQSMPIESAVRLWKRGNAQAIKLKDDFSVKLIRYEDLCANPMEAVDDIADLGGIARCGALPLAGSSHVIGNAMRLEFSGAIQRDEQWRTLLSASEIARVRSATSRLRELFGYDASPSTSR